MEHATNKSHACCHNHVIGVTSPASLDDLPPKTHSEASSPHILSILHMDAPFDEASTSDADEREILESAHSGLYWDRIVSTRHLNLHPHNAFSDQGDDM